MHRRSFLLSATVWAAIPTVANATVPAAFNAWAHNHLVGGQTSVRIARRGETWRSVFRERAQLARVHNRQNIQLEAGQAFRTLPRGASMESLCPLPSTIERSKPYHVLVDPRTFAWGLYVASSLVRWGPAVCGGSWCADVGRACRTPRGIFVVTEVAGPDRRSSSYPIIEAAEGRGALMPYFMRLTERGVGLHARYINGTHATHGCIGLFYEDAAWLNQRVARAHQLTVTVLPY